MAQMKLPARAYILANKCVSNNSEDGVHLKNSWMKKKNPVKQDTKKAVF